ncbi:unnamed protein product [Amoebophrya sp. A25]|nr:unnamed protein product [Amoebophrya sp. A25]|eukprot:GSA25T00003946001.1
MLKTTRSTSSSSSSVASTSSCFAEQSSSSSSSSCRAAFRGQQPLKMMMKGALRKAAPAALLFTAGSTVAQEVPEDTSLERRFDKGFQYREIEGNLIGKATPLDADSCAAKCQDTAECVAWEVCAPIGSGCDGCYMVKIRPHIVDHPGWHMGFIKERAEVLPIGPPPVIRPTDSKGCKEFILKANGGDPNSEFHKPANMDIYNWCGEQLLTGALDGDTTHPKDIDVYGQHYPISLVTNFRDPAPQIPADVERELKGASTPEEAYYNPNGPGTVTGELHASVGTYVLPRSRNHAFMIPFYDTNIGHWIKEFGSMNVLQSYEMQSLLRPGDVVVDVGANLGSFTIPFAERVGRQGKVLAFEPFRWLFQLCTANVALNGLSNVWTYNMGLGEAMGSFESRPPQLRFFSSPDANMKQEQAMQLYDYEMEPESVMQASLDDLLSQKSVRVPEINNLRLIKIDVEGMEGQVIMGAQRAIMHYKPIIWTENVDYFERNDTSFLALMDQLNYACGKAQNAPNDLICTDKTGQGNQVNEVFSTPSAGGPQHQEL